MNDAQASSPPQRVAAAFSNGHAGSQLHQASLAVTTAVTTNPSRFNLVHVLQIAGSLDMARLEESFRKLQARPLLASSVDFRDANPEAFINSSAAPEAATLLDLSGLHPAAQKYSFNSIVQNLQASKLILAVDQPYRASLVRWSAEKHSVIFLAPFSIVSASVMEGLTRALIQTYAEQDPRDAQSAGHSAPKNGKNGRTEFGEPLTDWSVCTAWPGREEIEEILELEAMGIFSVQIDGYRDMLEQRACEALQANLAKNALPMPVVVRPPLDRKSGNPSVSHGKPDDHLDLTIQTVTARFAQSVGSVHFYSGEIRNPICDADLSLHLYPREGHVRMLLNYDSEQFEEVCIRCWLAGYRDVFAQFLSIYQAQPSNETSKAQKVKALANGTSSSEYSPSGKQTEGTLPRNGITFNSADVHTPSSSAELNAAPSSSTEKALARIWSELLAIDPIGVDENFFDLGGHSLLAVRLFSRIANEFGRELSLNALLEHTTIRQLAKLLAAPAPLQVDSECRLIPLARRTPPAKPPFFWIPGGRGISVMAFREVSQLLGADRPVYGLESRLPGEGEHILTVPERASKYVSLLRTVQPQGPYHLAGFCMGGIVAFEMAQQLKAAGEEVAFLALIQASMPGFPASDFQRWRMLNQHRWDLAKTLLKFLSVRISGGFFNISRDAKQQVYDQVSTAILGWLGTSAEVPDETQTRNSQVMYEYRPHPYVGEVHLILAKDCYESSGIRPDFDSRRAWFSVIRGNCFIHIYPGDHNSIIAGINASGLANGIRTLIENTAKEGPPRNHRL